MFPTGQSLFASKIPLFSKLAANSTFTPLQQVSASLLRFNWAQVNAGHFLSDLAFFGLGFLLLSLAMSYGKQFARRGFGAMLLRAGRVWGALWSAVAALCLVVAAIDLSRLPISSGVAIIWTAVLAIVGAALFILSLSSFKSRDSGRLPMRRSETAVKASGFVIALGCASLLWVVDFPPQTSLGWLVVQLLILGIPAGVGFLLPTREALKATQESPEPDLKGARYFKRWDFVLLVVFGSMLILATRAVPELGQNNILPLIQALLLAICLFNRAPQSEIAERPRELFGNVLSAMIVLQFVLPLGWFASLHPPQPVHFTAYLTNYLTLAFAALLVALVLSLRVLPKGEQLARPWFRMARFWVLAGLVAVILLGPDFGFIVWTSGPISEPKLDLQSVIIVAVLACLAFFTRRRDLRRSIRFTLVGASFVFALTAFVGCRLPGKERLASIIIQFLLPYRYGIAITLALLLVVLTFKKPAERFALALRGRTLRVASYSLLIVIALLCRGLSSFPSYPIGSWYYCSAGLTENDQRALNILLPENPPELNFLKASSFPDTQPNHGADIYAWAGVMPLPMRLPEYFQYIPKIMGTPPQLVVGAARVTRSAEASDVRLEVLYSRRVAGTGLADMVKLQLLPNKLRRQAHESLNTVQNVANWARYYDYPRAIIGLSSPIRHPSGLIGMVVSMAITSLEYPPGQEAQKLFWRIDGMPGVTIY
ncbi:MAG TPA: hypothetical protein VM163_11480 [bacterium]|nr:hypothetical protein [bacterium]